MKAPEVVFEGAYAHLKGLAKDIECLASVMQVFDQWKLTLSQQRILLGIVDSPRAHWHPVSGRETMERVKFLLAILLILRAISLSGEVQVPVHDQMARALVWLGEISHDQYKGETSLKWMLRGGLVHLERVWLDLDATWQIM